MVRCRDLTAELLHEVWYDVETEPQLNHVTGETFSHKTANTTDDARVDVSARGFWVRGQKAFFDVRIFNPTAKSYSAQTLSAAHKRSENEKKRSYNDRILQIEHGTFTPLIFTCFGGMSRECQKFYSRLSEIISDKRELSQSLVTNWVRTKISFSIVRSLVICVRGSRSHRLKTTVAETDIKLAAIKSNIE